jgi:hypothetical protein
MTRPPLRARILAERLVVGASALFVVALVPSFASCADSEQGDGSEPDASTTLGEASADSGLGASTDANTNVDSGCDPSDSNCVTDVLSCDEAVWCPVPTTVSSLYSLTSIWGSGPNDIWSVGSGGTIIHYDGTAWKITPTEPATMNTLRSVWGSGPNDVWTVSMTNVIFHTTGFTNGVATWTSEPGPGKALPDDRAATIVWGTGPNDVRIGFRPRFLLDPTPANYNQWVKKGLPDGSASWELAKGEGYILGFWGSANDLWYVADNSDSNGWQRAMTAHGTPAPSGDIEWVTVDSQSASTLEAIWGSGPNDIWAVGDKGTIRHMTDGGSRWDIVSSPTTNALHAIWGSGPSDIWAAGDHGTILHFDGNAWTKSTAAFPIGKKPRLAGIWGSGPNDVWIVGDSIALHYTGPKPGIRGGE